MAELLMFCLCGKSTDKQARKDRYQHIRPPLQPRSSNRCSNLEAQIVLRIGEHNGKAQLVARYWLFDEGTLDEVCGLCWLAATQCLTRAKNT